MRGPFPAKNNTLMKCWIIVGRRRKQWTNFIPAFVQCLVFAWLIIQYSQFLSGVEILQTNAGPTYPELYE